MKNPALTRRLAEVCFALEDAILFLDTHPDSAEALAYYNQKKVACDAVQKEYRDSVGPLSARNVSASNHWTWIDTPWPWQMEE
ncbi:MAG: spore coat protein CotJB [Oscillospiraceae bacterium]